MKRVVLDQATLAILLEAKSPLEICDVDGRVLGHFQPTMIGGSEEPPFIEDELREREREPGGRSLAELLADLEKRG